MRTLLAALLILVLVSPAGGAEPALEVSLRVGMESPEIEGTIRFPSGEESVRIRLPANRFAEPPPWNDLERHFLLSGPTWEPGGTELVSLSIDGRPHDPPEVAAGAREVDVPLGSRTAPAEVVIGFRTRLPPLLDLFGHGATHWVAHEGWLPVPEGRHGPVRVRFEAVGGHLLVAGRPVAAGEEASYDEPPPLLLAEEPPRRETLVAGGTNVVVYHVESPMLRHRVSRNRPPGRVLADTLGIVAGSSGREEVRVVVLPLAWLPTGAGPDVVWVSDRLFHVHPLLRALHQRELAYAVFRSERLAAGDEPWVAEGRAWRRARDLYRERFREGPEVRDWIGLFDVFAIVDRFETSPRVPFARTFFPGRDDDDPLDLRSGERRPPGRSVFARLESRLGTKRFSALVEDAPPGRFRERLEAAGGPEIAKLLDAWLAPPVPRNYRLTGTPGESFEVVREGPGDPDAVELAAIGPAGERRFFLELEDGRAAGEWPEGARALVVDPGRTWPETRLDDNRLPGEIHWLLDSADVEVSSSEFGFSTLLVGRRRYDYAKDLAVAGFYTSRGVGFHAGGQLHGGAEIDRNLRRHNLFGYYAFQALDPDFREGEGRAERLAGLGFRYNFSDTFWFENPSRSHHVRVFFDAFDRMAGSDADFVQTGIGLAATRPLRDDTIAAIELQHGSIVPTRGGDVPVQALFSLGGFRGVRAIGAEERLARHSFVIRGELRHLLPVRLDLDFEDALVARRLQLRGFVDAGEVAGRADLPYDPSRWAVGVGGGLNLFYDFLGFFPSNFYVDVAVRVDRTESPEILFGARQPF